MKIDNKMDFLAKNPQLENDPNIQRFGRKRFLVSKNEGSPQFPIGDSRSFPAPRRPSFLTDDNRLSRSLLTQADTSVPNAVETTSSQLKELRAELSKKNQEIEELKRIKRSSSQLRRPPPVIYNPNVQGEGLYRQVLSKQHTTGFLSSHSALFSQPRFTKSNPKYIPTSPITGLLEKSLSRFNSYDVPRKRRMANYGELMITNKP